MTIPHQASVPGHHEHAGPGALAIPGRARGQDPALETFQNNTRLIDLQLIDRAGHPSNVLAGQATLEGRSPKP
jgi:hypothetical protein